MANYEKLLEIADKLGYQGNEKSEFVKREIQLERQTRDNERDQRVKERAADKEERDAQLQLRKLELELQLEMAKLNVNNDNNDKHSEGQSRSKRFVDKVKLREFKPKEDSIENFIQQFELICLSKDVHKQEWVTLLLSKLTGPSMSVLAILSDEDRKDYDIVKIKVLSFFGNTEDFYCRTYHNIRLDKDKDPNNVILEIKNNILRLLQLAEINMEDPKQILEMFIIDNILSKASKFLFTFYKKERLGQNQVNFCIIFIQRCKPKTRARQ